MKSNFEDLKQVRSFEGFNDFEDFIVVQNSKTKDIVFTNDAYKKEIEAHKNQHPDYEKRFLSINSFKLKKDRVDYTVLVSDTLETDSSTSNRIESRKMLSYIAHAIRDEIHNDFVAIDNGKSIHEKIIDDIIHKTITFYGSKYGQLFLFPENSEDSGRVYEYHLGSKKVASLDPKEFNINIDSMSFDYLIKGYSLICDNIEFFKNINKDLYRRFSIYGIKGIAVIPFYAQGKIIGVLIISKPLNMGGVLDPFLVDYAANAIAIMTYRGGLFKNIYYNSVTQLFNTGVISNFYPSFLEKNEHLPIAFIEFGVMHIDSISRVFGIAKTDKILKSLADIIKKQYSSEILSYQEGTNTFTCIATGVAENFALEAKNLQNEISRLYPDVAIDLAFGIYQLAKREEPFHDSKAKCSYAYQYACEHPDSRVRVYDNSLEETKINYTYLINNFHSSIKERKFKLYIQPKYNNEKNSYYGGEALSRWHLDGKVIMPGDYIPLFEANGFCKELDLYILGEVCRKIAHWIKHTPNDVVPISVNLSRVDFSDAQLFEKIMFVVNEYKVPTKYIELEITESVWTQNEKNISTFVQKCHEVGLKILMDDFGSGESSFNSLKNLEIDGIKLDYKFLSKEGDNVKKRKIIESIVSLARAINVSLVVEGVETNSEASYFRRIGVRHMQGYLFGKPMLVEEFEKINNKTAEFGFKDISDSRLFLNDILATESNVNLFFNQMKNPVGVVKLEKEHIYFVMINSALREILSKVGQLSEMEKSDITAFLDSKTKKNMIDILKSNLEQYTFTPREVFTFHMGFKDYLVSLCIMLIKKKESESYFIFDAIILNDSKSQMVRSINENDFDWMMTSEVYGYAVFDENYTLLRCNKVYSGIYPDHKVGHQASSVGQEKLAKDGSISRIYLRQTKSVYEIEVKHYNVEGKKYIIAKYSNIGAPTTHVGDLNNSGFKFLDRFLSTCQTIASYYIEVDLDNDIYVESRLDNPFDPNEVLRIGQYSKDIMNNIDNNISDFDHQVVKKNLDMAFLIESSHIKTPVSFTFKLRKQKVFYRVNIKFYYDGGRRYACMFLSNVTNEKIKDYDLLTDCMARTSGISIINKHIKENPIQKMALIILDLDDFKLLNDTYGHPLGDKVLAQMHSCFKKLRKEYNFGTRLGGDEFAILLRDRGEKFSEQAVIKEIEGALSNIGKQVGLDQEIHASYGIALIPEDGTDFHTLYSTADNKLYNHKNKKKVSR